jgi:hypothetical protein
VSGRPYATAIDPTSRRPTIFGVNLILLNEPHASIRSALAVTVQIYRARTVKINVVNIAQ